VRSEPSEKQRAKLRQRQASAPAKAGKLFPLKVDRKFYDRYDKLNGADDCCNRQRFLLEECDHQGIAISTLPVADLDDCCARAQLAQTLAKSYELGILRPEITGEG
jgi:hypothetical protein